MNSQVSRIDVQWWNKVSMRPQDWVFEEDIFHPIDVKFIQCPVGTWVSNTSTNATIRWNTDMKTWLCDQFEPLVKKYVHRERKTLWNWEKTPRCHRDIDFAFHSPITNNCCIVDWEAQHTPVFLAKDVAVESLHHTTYRSIRSDTPVTLLLGSFKLDIDTERGIWTYHLPIAQLKVHSQQVVYPHDLIKEPLGIEAFCV